MENTVSEDTTGAPFSASFSASFSHRPVKHRGTWKPTHVVGTRNNSGDFDYEMVMLCEPEEPFGPALAFTREQWLLRLPATWRRDEKGWWRTDRSLRQRHIHVSVLFEQHATLFRYFNGIDGYIDVGLGNANAAKQAAERLCGKRLQWSKDGADEFVELETPDQGAHAERYELVRIPTLV